jgi:hypothetical protein
MNDKFIWLVLLLLLILATFSAGGIAILIVTSAP